MPWPVPRQYLFVRASIRSDPTADGGVIAIAQSQTPRDIEPPPGTKLPKVLEGREHLAVGLAVARLRPFRANPSGSSLQELPESTTGEVYVTFDLSRVPGLSSTSTPPSWLVNLVVWICVPSIWTQYLAAIALIGQPGSRHLSRIHHDETGLYHWVEKRTRQPLPSGLPSDVPSGKGPRRALADMKQGGTAQDRHRRSSKWPWAWKWWKGRADDV